MEVQSFGLSNCSIRRLAQHFRRCKRVNRSTLDNVADWNELVRSAATFTIPSGIAPDHFNSHQPSVIGSDIGALFSFSLESTLQRAQRHSAEPAELASGQTTGSILSHQALNLVASPPPARLNFF